MAGIAEDLKCIVKSKTCFKNPEKPRCSNPFLTNFPCCFQNATEICTGLSDIIWLLLSRSLGSLKQNLK